MFRLPSIHPLLAFSLLVQFSLPVGRCLVKSELSVEVAQTPL
jgi:hypothetical protein